MQDKLEKQVEKNTVSITLMEQTLSYMKSGIDDIKTEIASLKHDLMNGFVNKDQFTSLKNDVDDLKRMRDWAIKIIIGSIILALLSLIILKP